MEWCFASKSWKAEFVTGDFAGTNLEFGTNDLTRSQWAKMGQHGFSGAEEEFNDLTYVKKKQVCKALMELWCGAITRNETKDFEETWGLEVHRHAVPTGKRARAPRER